MVNPYHADWKSTLLEQTNLKCRIPTFAEPAMLSKEASRRILLRPLKQHRSGVADGPGKE